MKLKTKAAMLRDEFTKNLETKKNFCDNVSEIIDRINEQLDNKKYKKILIVDDNISMIKMIKSAIETGFGARSDKIKILGLSDPKFAAIALRHFEPDLAILDIRMPGMTGDKIIPMLDKSCNVIVISAYQNELTEKLRDRISY